MAGKSSIGQFLKEKGSNQREAAAVVGISQSAFSLKANGFSKREIDKLARHYNMNDIEIKNVFY